MKFEKIKTDQHQRIEEEPKDSAAPVTVKSFSGNPEWDDMESSNEKIVRTGRFEKAYRHADGSCTAVFDEAASQYQEADGSYRKIENELVEEIDGENECYRNKANSFVVRFPKKPTKQIFSVERGIYSVAFSLTDPYDASAGTSLKKKMKGCFKSTLGKEAMLIPEADSVGKLCFPAFSKGGDLEYSVQDDRVKENIILHEKRSQYHFAFLADLKNLSMQKEEDGGVCLYSDDLSESVPIFRIPAPVMYDAEGASSDLVTYEIEQVPGEEYRYLFLIHADSEWINADERVFPVTVDPQVLMQDTENETKLIQVSRFRSDCTCNCREYFTTGNYRIGNNGAENDLLRVTLQNPASAAKVFDKDVRVTRASFIWKAAYGSGCGHYMVKENGRTVEHFVYDSQPDIRVDITNLLNRMLRENLTSAELFFEPSTECECNQYLYLKNEKGALELLVDYIPNGLVENNSESVSFDVKQAGTGAVNLATGKVLFEHSDVTTDSAIMPVSVSHIFDGANANREHGVLQYTNQSAQITPDYGMGKGWKLNVQQTLVVPDRNVFYRTGDFLGKSDKIYYIDGTGKKIAFEKKFFYRKDGVKHFIAQTDCKKSGKDYVVDQNGLYKTEIDGKVYDVTASYMSDNGLFLSMDQSKAMYLDEREYEKYYEYKGIKHSITLKTNTSFDYDAFYFKWENSNITQEIDSRYVKKDGDHYYVIVDMRQLDGTFKTMEAFPRTYTKFLSKDRNGEYFYIYSPQLCKSGTSYHTLVQERVDVLSVNIFTQDAVSISNAHFSNELIQADSLLSELNQAIVDLDESHESYIEQQIALRQNQRLNDQLNDAQSKYYQIQGELTAANVTAAETQYNEENEKLQNQIKAYNEELTKLDEWEATNDFDQLMSWDWFTYHGKEESIREELNAQIKAAQKAQSMLRSQKEQAHLQEQAFRIQERMNDLQVSASKSNLDDQMKVLWDAREKVRTQKWKYVDLRNKKLEERNLIIRNEKKLPCDYIFDESGNVMAFDYYGRLIGIQNSNRNVISIKYDDQNLLTSIATADETEISFAYNKNGRLNTITDTCGRITRYEYAANDPAKLVKIYSPEYDTEHPEYVISFEYDSAGRLKKITDPSKYYVQLAYSYNQITLSEHTTAAEISESGITETPNHTVLNGESTVIAFRSPYLTAVTANHKTTVYQLDLIGRVAASYEEEKRLDSDRIAVSKATACVYNGKNRVYSVQTDENKANLIASNASFDSTVGWSFVGGAYTTSWWYTDGTKGLCLYGSPDSERRVYRTISTFPAGKRHFLLSLWAKAQSGQIDSERCTGYEDQYLIDHTNTELFDNQAQRKFGIRSYVVYTNGKTETFYVSFDWYNTEWQLCQLPMRLSGTPKSMQISFEYGYNINTAYIDNFRLTAEYGTESRFSDDGKLLWQSDGITESYFTYNGGPYPVEVLEVDSEDAIANNCTQKCATCAAKATCKHAVNKYGFNSFGQLLWSEDHNGMITRNTYDENGRQISGVAYHEGDPTGKYCSEIVYDDHGREIETADPRGEVNGQKLVQKMKYQSGTNLLQTVISAGGKKTEYGYHHLNDVCVSISADDNGVENTNKMLYFVGYLVRVDNHSGMWYNYVYDGFGKLKKVLINGTDCAIYDENEDTDGSKVVSDTLAGCDTYTAKSDKDGHTTEVKYGNTIVKNGFSYESDRCTGYTEFPNDTARKKVHIYHYEELKNSHQAGTVTASYTNDSKGKATGITYTIAGSVASSYTFNYENDFDGTLKSIAWNGGITQYFTRDKLGRQTGSILKDTKGDTLYSKKAGYLKYGDHTTNLITDLQYQVKSKAGDREKYSYDADGNISEIHENGRLKVRYGYDGLNRLVREDNRELNLTTTFEYDNGGNLLRQNEYTYSLKPTDELADSAEIVYTYGNESSPDQLTKFKDEKIEYLANGCPCIYRGNDCSYELGTMLSKYGTHTFSYDADGTRTKKDSITYTYIDGKLIRQTGGAAGQIDFIYGASGMVGFKRSGTTYLYRRNLMGDVTHIYTMDGTLQARYVYDAWGNHKVYGSDGNEVTSTTHIGNINPIRYRGYYYDIETGLYYLQSRYYDPETGRFISQDDISYLSPKDLTGLNLFAYCNNNPVMHTDPLGYSITLLTALAIVSICAAIGALSSAIISGATYAMTTSDFSWRDFGASVAGGAVSGFLSGAGAGFLMLSGGTLGFMIGAGAAIGIVSSISGTLVEGAINGNLQQNTMHFLSHDVVSSAVWGGIFGALSGLVGGASPSVKEMATQAGRTLEKQLIKILNYQVLKKIVPTFFENLISDFTSWYAQFGIEKFVESF